ncbi:hypothetical protein V1290_005642 [Bradyrhizobium sp. AZCC 1578]|uniref:hypothetical protein n=1 Tax=unclassified Bradyrhizobium TaxID=2631580 RepID=UPI002FF0F606
MQQVIEGYTAAASELIGTQYEHISSGVTPESGHCSMQSAYLKGANNERAALFI